MPDINDPSVRRAAKAYFKQGYERDMVRGAQGNQAQGLDAIGFPTWSRDAWERFKAVMGRYPSLHEGDLPNMQGAPDWAFELQGLRKPPVDVTTGSAGFTDPMNMDLTQLRGRRRDSE